MSTTLHLSMYAKRGKRASLVLKRNGLMYRVNNLLSPLAFMANMVQLAKAIESGGPAGLLFTLVRSPENPLGAGLFVSNDYRLPESLAG